MIDFRISFAEMMTNLYDFSIMRDYGFKSGYLAGLPTNTSAWENIRRQQADLTLEQRFHFIDIDIARQKVFQLPTKIFDAVEGEHANEDLYLFRNQSVPQSEEMMRSLNQVTARSTDTAAGRPGYGAQRPGQCPDSIAHGRLACPRLRSRDGGCIPRDYRRVGAAADGRRGTDSERRLAGSGRGRIQG